MYVTEKHRWYDVEYVPRLRFSEDFLGSYDVCYPDYSPRRVSARIECIGGWEHGITKWIRVDPGVVVDYDYLKSVAMDAMGLEFQFSENPHIVEMATRGWIFTERQRHVSPLPDSGDVLLCGSVEAPVWWESIVLVLPEDVTNAKLLTMSFQSQADAMADARLWWNTDRRNWVEKGYDAIVSAIRQQQKGR